GIPDIFFHPYPRKIFVSLPVAEPSPHLHECVVLTRSAHEETDDQARQRQATREHVSTDHDVPAAWSRVVNPVLASPVLDLDIDGVRHRGKPSPQLLKRHLLIAEATCIDNAGRF